MHKFMLFILLLMFTGPFVMAGVHRGGAELLNPSAYSVNTSAMIFQTSAFYDNEGKKKELDEGNKFHLIDVDLDISYGVSKDLELTALVRFREVSSTVGENVNKNSGPESLGVEAKYALPKVGRLRYAIGVHYRQTLYTNANYADILVRPSNEIVLGDSGSEYGVDLYLTHAGPTWKFDGKMGYVSPANNLSSEINYKFEAMYRLNKFALFTGVDGIYSLKNDEFTDTTDSKVIQATAGTKLFNSINRERVAPYVGANYSFDKFILALKGQSVVAGTSTDKGNSITLSFGLNSDGVTSEFSKVESFKEYQVDGSVLKVSARANFIRIDQGLSTDVEKGMKFDIYQTDYFGGNILVGTGVVYEVGPDWSTIKLLKKYKEIQIKPGFAARGY